MKTSFSLPRLIWSAFLASVLGASAVLHTGCIVAAVGAGAGAVAYLRGELSAPLDASYEEAARAASRAIEQLKFSKISQKQDAMVTVFIARTAEDKRIEVKISTVAKKQSKAQIRVGLIGDETLSLHILEKIKSNL